MNFSYSPYEGVGRIQGLVGCWDLNEGTGTVAVDASGNGNNGTITGANWITGLFGNALNFTAGSRLLVSSSASFNISDHITLCAWIYPASTGQNGAGRIIAKNDPYDYGLAMNSDGSICFVANGRFLASSKAISLNKWHFVVGTFDKDLASNQVKIYVDGVLKGQATLASLSSSSTPIYIGNRADNIVAFNGTIDCVSIYNRTLSAVDVTSLYVMGEVPDPVSFASYYNYNDSATNDIMLIHVNSPDNKTNSVLVTCTSFFVSNKLIFQANDSVSLNVWTTLGQPVFTSGVWNSQNYTTSLTVNASSTCQLDWTPGASPSVSNISITPTYAGNTTIFSALWSDNQSLSGGGYIFCTNNTGQWTNSTWIAFDLNPDWGNTTLTLNSTAGIPIGFREYANNTLNLWGDTGIYAVTTTVVSTSIATVTPTPTPLVAASTKPTPKPTSTISSNATVPGTPVLTPSTAQNSFPTQMVLYVVVIIIVLLVVVLTFAFKKGYVSIELVDEDSPVESSDDYTI